MKKSSARSPGRAASRRAPCTGLRGRVVQPGDALVGRAARGVRGRLRAVREVGLDAGSHRVHQLGSRVGDGLPQLLAERRDRSGPAPTRAVLRHAPPSAGSRRSSSWRSSRRRGRPSRDGRAHAPRRWWTGPSSRWRLRPRGPPDGCTVARGRSGRIASMMRSSPASTFFASAVRAGTARRSSATSPSMLSLTSLSEACSLVVSSMRVRKPARRIPEAPVRAGGARRAGGFGRRRDLARQLPRGRAGPPVAVSGSAIDTLPDGATLPAEYSTMQRAIPPRAQGAALDRAGKLWVSSSNCCWGALDRIDLATGVIERRFDAAAQLEGIAFDESGRLMGRLRIGGAAFLRPAGGRVVPVVPPADLRDRHRKAGIARALMGLERRLPRLVNELQFEPVGVAEKHRVVAIAVGRIIGGRIENARAETQQKIV